MHGADRDFAVDDDVHDGTDVTLTAKHRHEDANRISTHGRETGEHTNTHLHADAVAVNEVQHPTLRNEKRRVVLRDVCTRRTHSHSRTHAHERSLTLIQMHGRIRATRGDLLRENRDTAHRQTMMWAVEARTALVAAPTWT